MKEVKEPFEFIFPLKGAGLEEARPDEEEIEETETLEPEPGASAKTLKRSDPGSFHTASLY